MVELKLDKQRKRNFAKRCIKTNGKGNEKVKIIGIAHCEGRTYRRMVMRLRMTSMITPEIKKSE